MLACQMRFATLLFVTALLAGCTTHRDDARLQGTWHSNRNATVAAAFERDPRWTNAPPEKVQRFRDIFGYMTLTYSNGIATSNFRGETNSFRYRVIKRRADYVVIRDDAPAEAGQSIRIRFENGNTAYWIASPFGFGIEERFDKVIAPPGSAPASTAAAR
jgi:hypothetical protein